jgi:SAM-dependent methyltransferase
MVTPHTSPPLTALNYCTACGHNPWEVAIQHPWRVDTRPVVDAFCPSCFAECVASFSPDTDAFVLLDQRSERMKKLVPVPDHLSARKALVSAKYKADFINAFIRDHRVTGVIELGCGDGNQLLFAEYPEYVGVDTSEAAVDYCNQLFLDDDSKIFISERCGITADLALSLDVIDQLDEDDVYEPYMRDLFDAAERFVVIYANDVDEFDADTWGRNFTSWIHLNAREWRLRQVEVALPGNYQDFHVFEKSESRNPLDGEKT